jgi:Lrp/AsnC family leucine-responsive transcriptional regulator
MKRLRFENGPLDRTDEAILKLLTEDARLSIAELARKVSMSAPSVSERIKRLEEAGIITQYSATINYQALGRPIAAWLRIRPTPGQHQKIVEILQALPEIVECDRITGEDCFIARAYVKSVEDLESVIDQIIPYSITNTSIIQSSPVTRRLPPIIS